MPPGSQQGAPGGIRTLLPRLTWLDVLVRIVGPDPASFIHVGSDTEIRRVIIGGHELRFPESLHAV